MLPVHFTPAALGEAQLSLWCEMLVTFGHIRCERRTDITMSSLTPTEIEIISSRAYQLWEASGYQHGHDQEHWNQAEHELREHQLREEQAANRGKTVEPPTLGHKHTPETTPHTTGYNHPGISTDALHHQRVGGGRGSLH